MRQTIGILAVVVCGSPAGLSGQTSPEPTLDYGPHGVGFTVMEALDSTRARGPRGEAWTPTPVRWADNQGSPWMRRRDFCVSLPLVLAASTGALLPSCARRRPLRVLILGGTGFVGPHLARAAIAAGHEVTLFNRGVTNPDTQLDTGE